MLIASHEPVYIIVHCKSGSGYSCWGCKKRRDMGASVYWGWERGVCKGRGVRSEGGVGKSYESPVSSRILLMTAPFGPIRRPTFSLGMLTDLSFLCWPPPICGTPVKKVLHCKATQRLQAWMNKELSHMSTHSPRLAQQQASQASLQD